VIDLSITISPRALLLAGLVEAAIAAVCMLSVLVHATWQRRADVTRARRRHDSQVLVNRCLLSSTVSDADRSRLRRMPMRARIEVLTAFSTTFQGEERSVVHQLATFGGVTRLAERRCRSAFWSRRLQGARLFAMFGGGETIVPSLFDDRHEEVRAGAAEWAAKNPQPNVIERLLPLVIDESTFCRFIVKDAFLQIGAASANTLLAYLERADTPSEDVLDVARWVADARFSSVAARLAVSNDPRIRRHATFLAATIGGHVALDLLIAAVNDTEVAVRISALQGLQRMGDWRSAAACTKALGDPEWNVRREAGRALLAMGAPGTVLLRKALGSNDAFAADMARHMLDMPPGVLVGVA
jgi:hypothetical protein